MFKCDWCEEEYDDSLKFRVFLVDDSTERIEKGICCPDCISVWFSEDPESIQICNIEKISP